MGVAKKSMKKLCLALNGKSKVWCDLIEAGYEDIDPRIKGILKEAYLLISEVREIKDEYADGLEQRETLEEPKDPQDDYEEDEEDYG
jgi:hypothetical protein